MDSRPGRTADHSAKQCGTPAFVTFLLGRRRRIAMMTPGAGALGTLVIDRAGAIPMFLGTAVAFPVLALWFTGELNRRQRAQ